MWNSSLYIASPAYAEILQVAVKFEASTRNRASKKMTLFQVIFGNADFKNNGNNLRLNEMVP